MRFVDIARIAALISCGAVLTACPKKDSDAAPEPAGQASAQPSDAPAAAAPAAPKKKDDDKGGW